MLYIQIKSRSHSLKRPYLFKGLLRLHTKCILNQLVIYVLYSSRYSSRSLIHIE